jgi:methyl-accepting chemotaxis protein
MVLKFNLTSVIFVMILAVIVTLSVFTLTRSNIFAAVILAAAAVITFVFARRVVKPNTGVTKTHKDFSEDGGGLNRQIGGNSKDEAGALEGTAANYQSAAGTLVKNNVRVKSLMESYEEGLAGMQDVVADIQDIIHSIDNALQHFEAIDPRSRAAAEKKEAVR